MKQLYVAILAACLSGTFSFAAGQTKTVDTYSPQKLMSMVPQLREQADRSGGTATKVLNKYPDHYTVLAFRDRDGRAELHKKFADIFFVLDGKAALVSGGIIVNPKPSGATPGTSGEVEGDRVQGGRRVQLGKGDVVHIPANLPHQVLVPSGGSITYLIVKVQERP